MARLPGVANHAPAMLPAASMRRSSRPWQTSASWSMIGCSSERWAASMASPVILEDSVWSAVDMLQISNISSKARLRHGPRWGRTRWLTPFSTVSQPPWGPAEETISEMRLLRTGLSRAFSPGRSCS